MRSVLLVAAAAVLGVSTHARADRTFSDGVFTPTNWGFETFTVGGGGTASAAGQLSGGNPAEARRITDNVAAAAGSQIYAISRFGTDTASRYVASVDGAIGSVDFSIDSRTISGPGDGQTVQLAVKQGTFLYVAGLATTGASGQWTSYSITGLTAADFIGLGGAPAIDFSATGQPIRFGLASSITSSGAAFTTIADYDNFFVRTHTVPAPGAAALLVGAACAMRRRRR